MCIEGYEIIDTHIGQLGEHISAVQRFPAGSFMLSAFIEEGHYHIYPMGLSCGRRNHSLQILVIIIRGSVVRISVDGIGQTMVTYIHDYEKILSSDGLPDNSFPFTASEAGIGGVHQVAVFDVSPKSRIIMFGIFHIFPEFNKIIVDTFPDGRGGFHGQNLQRGYRKCIFQFAYIWHILLLSVCRQQTFLYLQRSIYCCKTM